MARFIVFDNGIGVIDFVALRSFIFSQLKASVAVEDLQKLLPFQNGLELGDNYVHITNESAYPVSTQHHTIGLGDTLCKRGQDANGTVTGATPTCPGCIAKARGVIVNNLLEKTQNPLRVAEILRQVETFGFFL